MNANATPCLAAVTDDALEAMMENGDANAKAEMIRRGLADDPQMEMRRVLERKRLARERLANAG